MMNDIIEDSIASYLTRELLYKGCAGTRIDRGPVTCSVVWRKANQGDQYVELIGFKVEKLYLRQGFGSQLLTEILAWADNHHLTVSLSASPFVKAYGGMNLQTLVAFYERHGFVVTGASVLLGRRKQQLVHMTRVPYLALGNLYK